MYWNDMFILLQLCYKQTNTTFPWVSWRTWVNKKQPKKRLVQEKQLLITIKPNHIFKPLIEVFKSCHSIPAKLNSWFFNQQTGDILKAKPDIKWWLGLHQVTGSVLDGWTQWYSLFTNISFQNLPFSSVQGCASTGLRSGDCKHPSVQVTSFSYSLHRFILITLVPCKWGHYHCGWGHFHQDRDDSSKGDLINLQYQNKKKEIYV